MIVKICGITSPEDALLAVDAGASAVGLNFWRPGKRYLAPAAAREIARTLPAGILKVGVFVNEPPASLREIAREVQLDVVQLHGEETPEMVGGELAGLRIWKAARIGPGWTPASLAAFNGVEAFLLDAAGATPGGTGRTFDWTLARTAAQYGRVILAGGLTPESVAEAILATRPWGVDVASGVESSPGRKDPRKVRDFAAAARAAAQQLGAVAGEERST